MSKMTQHGIVKDLKDAARVMADTETFPTGQSIILDAAKEIERLRDELVKIHTDSPFVIGFNQGWDAALDTQTTTKETT